LGTAAALALPALTARAQVGITLATLQVALWPEFDKPATLVILDGSLPAGTSLPAELSLRIPAAAGEPHAVAVRGTGGNLLTASYSTNPAGDDIIVTFSTDSLNFRLEYYDPALEIEGQARHYTFDWTTDYAVADAAIRVQQPFGAADFVGEPALVLAGVGEYGLTYWQGDLGPLAAGQAVSLALSYAKPNATLSADAVGTAPVPAAQASSGATVAQPAGANLPVVLAALAVGLALVGAGAFIFVRQGQPARRRSARGRTAGHRRAGRTRAAVRAGTSEPSGTAARRRRAGGAAQRPAETAERTLAPAQSGAAFCTQCGRRRQPGDRFCRQCGASLPE
jgi:hypothetical protein